MRFGVEEPGAGNMERVRAAVDEAVMDCGGDGVCAGAELNEACRGTLGTMRAR